MGYIGIPFNIFIFGSLIIFGFQSFNFGCLMEVIMTCYGNVSTLEETGDAESSAWSGCKVGQLLHSLPVTGDLWSFPIPRDQGLAANPLGWSKTFQAARLESRFNGARLRGVLDWHGEVVLSNIGLFSGRWTHFLTHIFSDEVQPPTSGPGHI